METFDNFIAWALNKDWQIIENDRSICKPPQVYTGKIGVFESIIKKYKRFANPKLTTWLVLSECIDNTDPNSFSWDEFKKISLGSCVDESDRQRTLKWWDGHFPIIMSVENGFYEYYSINTETGGIGYSFEPFFEEEEIIAETLDDFFNKIINEEIILL